MYTKTASQTKVVPPYRKRRCERSAPPGSSVRRPGNSRRETSADRGVASGVRGTAGEEFQQIVEVDLGVRISEVVQIFQLRNIFFETADLGLHAGAYDKSLPEGFLALGESEGVVIVDMATFLSLDEAGSAFTVDPADEMIDL